MALETSTKGWQPILFLRETLSSGEERWRTFLGFAALCQGVEYRTPVLSLQGY